MCETQDFESFIYCGAALLQISFVLTLIALLLRDYDKSA